MKDRLFLDSNFFVIEIKDIFNFIKSKTEVKVVNIQTILLYEIMMLRNNRNRFIFCTAISDFFIVRDVFVY